MIIASEAWPSLFISISYSNSMIEDLPLFVVILFLATVIVTIVWMYAASRSVVFLLTASAWTILQSVLALKGVFHDTQILPPRLFILGVFPPLIAIAITFVSPSGRRFIDKINLETLTWLHIIRVPVEVCLLFLFLHQLVPVYMTFEGTNFDLFSGLTAPLVAYFAFRRNRVEKKLLFSWNLLCLVLLLNVVITAILAFPSPLQQISFKQPNIAIIYFPFNLLPTVLVPIVLFSHLAAFRLLSQIKAKAQFA
jgi:hypothetical protein